MSSSYLWGFAARGPAEPQSSSARFLSPASSVVLRGVSMLILNTVELVSLYFCVDTPPTHRG